jgi:rod shape-determining protein MreD
MKPFGWAIGFILVVLLEVAFAGFMTVYGIRPDFILLYLIPFSLEFSRAKGTAGGFAVGLIQDAFGASLFGLNAFCKAFAGFLVHVIPSRFLGPRFLHAGSLIFFVTLFHDFFYNWIYSLGTGANVIFIFFRYALPGAAYTAMLGLLIKAIFPGYLRVKRAE